jgi:hypothetical protein
MVKFYREISAPAMFLSARIFAPKKIGLAEHEKSCSMTAMERELR